MPRLRGEQVLVYVSVTTNNYKYGFKTNKQKFSGYGSALGQKSAVGESGVFYGANSPKPGIARKKFTSGSVSSFFDPSKRTSLAKSGWTLSNGAAAQGIRSDGLSVTVAVEVPAGYYYTYNITKADLAMAKELGAFQPTDADKIIWGSYPKPPRGTKRDASGTKSTFVAPDNTIINQAILAGWSVTAPDPDLGIV